MRFQVFKDGKVVDKFSLKGAYMFGTDGIAIRRADIGFSKGLVECEKSTMEAAGLTLLWPVEGFGQFLLPTTCLPERARPYIMNVEIARARLMQIIRKREDWGLFDELKGLEGIGDEAQKLFVEGIQNLADPPLASKLADESLKKAMILSERLAAVQGETMFEARSTNRGFGRGCLCCNVDARQVRNATYTNRLLEVFGFVSIPLKWSHIEPQRGEYDFSGLDACIEALGKRKAAISAGPLLCFSKEHLPPWLLANPLGFEKIREMAYNFVSTIVTRYSSRIRAWRVISGMNAQNHFEFSFEQVLEMTRAVNMAVKAASERALKIIVVSDPWGEYYASTPSTIPPLVYMDMVVQSGINFDAFGVEMCFGKDADGFYMRDMLQISGVLDYFQPIGKPLYIVETEVPGPVRREEAEGLSGDWNQERQRAWIENFYRIALGKPFVDTVTYSNLADVKDSDIPYSGLLTENLEPKASYVALRKLQKHIFARQGPNGREL